MLIDFFLCRNRISTKVTFVKLYEKICQVSKPMFSQYYCLGQFTHDRRKETPVQLTLALLAWSHEEVTIERTQVFQSIINRSASSSQDGAQIAAM